jgi:hypothetical protein
LVQYFKENPQQKIGYYDILLASEYALANKRSTTLETGVKSSALSMLKNDRNLISPDSRRVLIETISNIQK